ncbi:MAG TPA: hypothetical protein VNR65_10520 [Geobacterales bacterium]|nr:hypothetical protein [Geobacterales bacterium]
MGRHASFDSDQAPRHIGEPGCDPAAGDLLPQNDCPPVVEADQMQGVLARIDADGVCACSGCLMGHSDVLLVLLSPRSFSERFWAGARPVHPVLGCRTAEAALLRIRHGLLYEIKFLAGSAKLG